MFHINKCKQIQYWNIGQHSTLITLSCTCYLPRCKCLAQLQPNILCTLGTTPMTQPPLTPIQNLKVQFQEFTYGNERFPQATRRKLKVWHTKNHHNPTRMDGPTHNNYYGMHSTKQTQNWKETNSDSLWLKPPPKKKGKYIYLTN